jgi:hypothetical protein
MATQRTQQKRRRSDTGRKGRGTRTATRPARKASRSTRSRTSTNRSMGRGSKRTMRDLQGMKPDQEKVEELILQALETEMGGVQVYQTAIACAVNDDLREEWEEYLDQTKHHVEVVEQLCQQCGIDAQANTPGRAVVRHLGESLVAAMQKAQSEVGGTAAELVAAECVTLAETKDHLNWTLLAELANADFEWADSIRSAVDEVEDEEDEHLYHTMGWSRELWIDGFGLPAALPPPEEERDVKSMAQAAKAKAQRKRFVKAR